jgi:hypothetical protein
LTASSTALMEYTLSGKRVCGKPVCHRGQRGLDSDARRNPNSLCLRQKSPRKKERV